jgi:acyl dehydratase
MGTAVDDDAEGFSFEDLPKLVGRKFVSPWLRVDDEHTTMFDDSTYYDPAEWGWDVESFPDSMIEGLHLLSLLPLLGNRALPFADSGAFVVAYGFDRVRFVTPVYVGEPLRLRGEIAEVRPKDEGYLMLQRCELEVEGRDRPGVVADFWGFVMPQIREEFKP